MQILNAILCRDNLSITEAVYAKYGQIIFLLARIFFPKFLLSDCEKEY